MQMNTLTNMYEDLSAEERASMMFAALTRDDETEVNRLMDSAPMLNWRMCHHSGVAGVLVLLAQHRRNEQLEAAANYTLARWRLQMADENATEDEAGKVGMWACVADTSAYLYHIGEEAWNTFCDEIGVTSADLLDGAPGQWIIDLCDLNMADVAPTRDELKKQLRAWNGQFDHSGELVDVEFLTEQWRRLYRECLGAWPSS